jgi:integrase
MMPVCTEYLIQHGREERLAHRASRSARAPPLFVTYSGTALSRDALEHRLAKYVQIAGGVCPTLAQKSVTMHILRHSTAMRLLRAGIDTSVIALWLGHENVDTTQVYLHADLTIAHWPGQRPRKADPAAFAPLTSCSPFWRRSDYAASFAAFTACQAGLAAVVGIIRRSA